MKHNIKGTVGEIVYIEFYEPTMDAIQYQIYVKKIVSHKDGQEMTQTFENSKITEIRIDNIEEN